MGYLGTCLVLYLVFFPINLILLWPENICVILVLLNMSILVLWSCIVSVLVNVPSALEKSDTLPY